MKLISSAGAACGLALLLSTVGAAADTGNTANNGNNTGSPQRTSAPEPLTALAFGLGAAAIMFARSRSR